MGNVRAWLTSNFLPMWLHHCYYWWRSNQISKPVDPGIAHHTWPHIRHFLSIVTMVSCTTLRNSTIIFALFWGFCFEFQTGPDFHLDSLILKLIMFLRRTQRVTDVFILQLSLPTVFSGNIPTAYFFHLNIWLFYHMNLLSLWILFSSHISQLYHFMDWFPKNSLLVLKEDNSFIQPIST